MWCPVAPKTQLNGLGFGGPRSSWFPIVPNTSQKTSGHWDPVGHVVDRIIANPLSSSTAESAAGKHFIRNAWDGTTVASLSKTNQLRHCIWRMARIYSGPTSSTETHFTMCHTNLVQDVL